MEQVFRSMAADSASLEHALHDQEAAFKELIKDDPVKEEVCFFLLSYFHMI